MISLGWGGKGAEMRGGLEDEMTSIGLLAGVQYLVSPISFFCLHSVLKLRNLPPLGTIAVIYTVWGEELSCALFSLWQA